MKGQILHDFIYMSFLNLFFIVISPNTLFSPMYSMGTQLHIHLYIIFSPIVVLHCNYLDIVLRATQQDIIVNPFPKQRFSSINPQVQILPTPSPSPWETTSLFSKSMIFFSVKSFICARDIQIFVQ